MMRIEDIPNISFPKPGEVNESYPGLIAVGGNLKPNNLISAYKTGLFPWYNTEEPILWWSLDPRMVLIPGEVRKQKDVLRLLNRSDTRVTLNTNPEEIITQCAYTSRKGQDGTWIQNDIIKAYGLLARENKAWCLGFWKENKLVAGLYGVKLGKMFFGESMFSHIPNGSKALLIWLCQHWSSEIELIDCQQETDHLKFMGAHIVDRSYFLDQVKKLT